MKSAQSNLVRTCIEKMIGPVTSFCVSRGLKFQDFIEIAKKSYVDEARRSLDASQISVSKISVMTGIQRPEAARILQGDGRLEERDLITRIVGQWVSDRRFSDHKKSGSPLSLTGTNSKFSKLVRTVSGDLNAHTIRFEMERLGIIEVKDGIAYLKTPAFVVKGDAERTIKLGAEDVRDLLSALQANAFSYTEIPHLHAKTEYDAIADEDLPTIRAWFLELGRKIHQECREFLAKFDNDITPKKSRGVGKNRIALATFSFIEEKQTKKGLNHEQK